MSFREEDREKDNNSSRGLGLGLAAAAAIGVGVGAALYYFINKRNETPTSEGSTTRGWTCESPQTLIEHEEHQSNSDDSYTTIYEQSTTDTSMYEDSFMCKCIHSDETDSSDSETETELSTEESSSSDETEDEIDESDVQVISSDDNDWDLTASSDCPSFEPPVSRNRFKNYARSILLRKEHKRNNGISSRRDDAL